MYDYQINKTGGNFMNRTLIALLLSASILFAGCGSTKEPAHNTTSETVTSTTVVQFDKYRLTIWRRLHDSMINVPPP